MKFDESYELLEDMTADSSFPKKLTARIKAQMKPVIVLLEQNVRDTAKLQAAFDKMTVAINPLMQECPDAEEIVAADVLYILEWFDIDLDVDDALRKRAW